MKLNLWAFTIASAIIWSATMMLITTINLLLPTYGRGFLLVISSIYPGYLPGVKGIFVGILYGFLDGAIFGAIFAMLYNKLIKT